MGNHAMNERKGLAILFGCGLMCRLSVENILKQYRIAAIVDSDRNKQGREVLGHKVAPPSEIPSIRHDVVIVTNSSLASSCAALFALGIAKEKIVAGYNFVGGIFGNGISYRYSQEDGNYFFKEPSDGHRGSKVKYHLFNAGKWGEFVFRAADINTVVEFDTGGLIEEFFELSSRHNGVANGVFFDVGANIGATTIQAARSPNVTKVVAFEPTAETFGVLGANILLNEASEKVVAVCSLVSGTDGQALFRVNSTDYAASESVDPTSVDGRSKHENAIRRVGAISIDSYVAANKISPDYLWIDVQGHELSVLNGARRLIDDRKVSIMIEWWPAGMRGGNSQKELTDFISSRFDRFAVVGGESDYERAIFHPRDLDGFTKYIIDNHGHGAHKNILLIR